MTSAVGVSMADIDTLLSHKLIVNESAAAPVQETPGHVASTATANETPAAPSEQALFEQALNMAIELASKAGFKGFGLTMELTGVGSMQHLRNLEPKLQSVIGYEKFKPLAALLKA
jgi:hypothetical protein